MAYSAAVARAAAAIRCAAAACPRRASSSVEVALKPSRATVRFTALAATVTPWAPAVASERRVEATAVPWPGVNAYAGRPAVRKIPGIATRVTATDRGLRRFDRRAAGAAGFIATGFGTAASGTGTAGGATVNDSRWARSSRRVGRDPASWGEPIGPVWSKCSSSGMPVSDHGTSTTIGERGRDVTLGRYIPVTSRPGSGGRGEVLIPLRQRFLDAAHDPGLALRHPRVEEQVPAHHGRRVV